jgi:purine-nucleoside phosphorylase
LTPHISANKGDFAKTILMPGDPVRSEFIAKNFLTDASLVNNVRGVQGYTGNYKSVPVSVMASGMGMPSIGIYSYELFNFYDVENIIRVGSAGSISPKANIRDIVIAMGACTNSNFASQYNLPGTFASIANYNILEASVNMAKALDINPVVGNVLSTDIFYNDDKTTMQKWANMGVLAVEMEAAALYMNAARLGKNALAICTISDNIFTGEETTSEERATSFTQMIELALNTAIIL